MASELGTGIKLLVGMTPIDGSHLEDVDFKVEVFSSSRGGNKVVVPKEEALRMDEDHYIICVDSAMVGYGDYYITLWAYIPDADFPDGVRPEGKTIKTNVTISNTR